MLLDLNDKAKVSDQKCHTLRLNRIFSNALGLKKESPITFSIKWRSPMPFDSNDKAKVSGEKCHTLRLTNICSNALGLKRESPITFRIKRRNPMPFDSNDKAFIGLQGSIPASKAQF